MNVQSQRKWLVTAAIFFLCLYGCKSSDAPEDKCNVVLITIDTLRADHLSCYGYERETTPRIDAIARQGMIFKNVVAPSSWTAPSMVSLFTSTYPINHGVIHGLEFQKTRGFCQEVFSETLRTLPEVLKDAGYTTFGVSSNHGMTAELGFGRGFDYFKYVNWQAADVINKIVYAWEDAIRKSDKFFLWVHYIDPHSPYFPQSPWITRYSSETLDGIRPVSRMPSTELIAGIKKNPAMLSKVLALYDSEINYVDSHVGDLIERLGLDRNALLIITADHGEQFMEHDSIGHAITLHQEELQVPLIIKFPGVTAAQSIERQASIVDVMPTIVSSLGIDQPEQTRGTPLLDSGGMPAGLGEVLPGWKSAAYHFAELESHAILKTVIAPPWKYIHDYKAGSGLLYDIVSDPLEKTNVKDAYPEQADAMRDQLLSFVSDAKSFPPRSLFIQIPPDDIEKLQTLGYLSTSKREDDDSDGVINKEDNCIDKPNGPLKGTCMKGFRGEPCVNHVQCGADGFCSMRQEDGDHDGIGDACDACEGDGAYDLDEDGLCDKAPSVFEKLWFAAEQADTMVSPFAIAPDKQASNGLFISAPNGSGSEFTPGGNVMAAFTAAISRPGIYFLWGRVRARNGEDDSFFVQVGDNADNLWEVERGKQWHWDRVNDRNMADPARFALKEGVHTIRIKLREDGTELDKLLLTNDPGFIPVDEEGVAAKQVHAQGR
jgi:arylsulfatase A-like enzyme